MDNKNIPTLDTIVSRYLQYKKYIHETPIMTSEILNEMAGCQLYFKCENFQKGGAFKARGAANFITQLTEDEMKRGIVTHSSGNHAGAVARMANKLNIKAYLVMPTNSPQIKKSYVQKQNGIIIDSDATVQSREAAMNRIIKEKGSIFVPPFNDYRIIGGQASVAYEIYNKVDNVDYLLAPISGGGLFSGLCLTTKYMSPKTKLIGVEPYLARDAYQSLKTGILQPQLPPLTIADGLRMPMGPKPFEIIKDNAEEILLVEENEIVEATNLIWKVLKIIVEPSSATVLAAVLKNKEKFKGKKVVMVLTGGNVDIQLPNSKL